MKETGKNADIMTKNVWERFSRTQKYTYTDEEHTDKSSLHHMSAWWQRQTSDEKCRCSLGQIRAASNITKLSIETSHQFASVPSPQRRRAACEKDSMGRGKRGQRFKNTHGHQHQRDKERPKYLQLLIIFKLVKCPSLRRHLAPTAPSLSKTDIV